MPILNQVCRIKNDKSGLLVVPREKSFGGVYRCRLFKDIQRLDKDEPETTWATFYPEELQVLTSDEIDSIRALHQSKIKADNKATSETPTPPGVGDTVPRVR